MLDVNSIPLTEGLYSIPDSSEEEPSLIGSKCIQCGEVYFPKRLRDFCVHCQKTGIEEIKLNVQGVISNFTIAIQGPAGGFYKGAVPYAYGFVDLPEGVRIQTQFSGNLNKLQIGEKVGLVLEKIAEDDQGRDIISYMFELIDE